MTNQARALVSLILYICGSAHVTGWGLTFTPYPRPWNAVKRSAPSPTCLSMISNLFSDSGKEKLPELPRDVKSAVSSCRSAVQAALSQRQSRMDIEFPVGTKFGVEKASKKRRRDAVGSVDGNSPTRADFQRSDRELARLFVDMFQPVGGDRITVAFCDAESADQAKQQWKGDITAQCQIVSMDQRKVRANKKKKAASGKGFAAKIAVELMDDDSDVPSGPFQLPENTEVALFVAPGPKELVTIEKICSQVGMGTLVVLLNARLAKVQKFSSSDADKLFQHEFEPVFSLTAAPQEEAPGCLLYRSFPGDWVLARKPKVGKPVSILSSPKRPSSEECRNAFESIEVSDVEKGIENVVDTLTGWLQ